MTDKLMVDNRPIAATVTINGQVICSSADWDRMVNFTLKENADLKKENERLKEENELYRRGFGLARSIQDHRNKDRAENENG